MRLYRLPVQGRARYVGTQADARALKRATGFAWEEVDVSAAPAPAPTGPALVEDQVLTPRRPAFDAASVLARMDNSQLDLDAVVEAIATMSGGYALKRVAGAVAIRFEELSR